ncbi:MAG: hypothetical protein K2M88_02085 [Muribaculaceae bacterium]|nr:hypothetical protein [Muribaculaceae bacterium]
MSRYKNPWKNFKNIQEYITTGIEDVTTDINENEPCEIFTTDGVRVGDSVEGLSKGIYVVRRGNKTKKIAVK